MLQIIGWILCVYLVVKCLELLAMQKAPGTAPSILANLGAVIALLSAIFFFFIVNMQATQTSPPFPTNVGG